MAGKPARHMVHGEWMTMKEAGERLGVGPRTIEQWRYKHRRTDGSMGLLEEAWDYYTGVRAGRIIHHPGKANVARRYWVNGRYLTIREAAARVGVKEMTMRAMIQKRGCSVQSAVRYYERKKKDEAVRAILGIIYE